MFSYYKGDDVELVGIKFKVLYIHSRPGLEPFGRN
jgi:hypothetical protein